MKTRRSTLSAACILLLVGWNCDDEHVGSLDSDHPVIEAAVVSFADFGEDPDLYALDETPTLWRWLEFNEQDLEGLRERLREALGDTVAALGLQADPGAGRLWGEDR